MKFEIEKEAIMDMIAIFGKEHAVNEMVNAFRAVLDDEVKEIDQELSELSKRIK